MKYIVFFLRRFYEIIFAVLAVSGVIGVACGNSLHLFTIFAGLLCWYTIRRERKQKQ